MGKTDAHGMKYILENGKRVPGVTTIIGGNLGWNKNVLIGWARKQALAGKDSNEVLRDAADTGTLAHMMVESHIKGLEVDTADYTANQIKRAERSFSAFLEWEEQTDFKIILSELTMVSEKMRVGGQIDILGKVGNRLVIGDVKTSKFIYAEHKIQLAAYAYMYEEIQPKAKVDHAIVIRLDKETGNFEHHTLNREVLDKGYEAFCHLLKLHYMKKVF